MKQFHEPLFTPEQELLLWSIRVDHTQDQRITEILSKGINWNYVRETAIQQGIIPLLYKRLKEEMSHLAPSNELEELRTLYMANAMRNLRMTQQLINVLDLLADAGIEAIPFKGPVLAVQAYNELSMRSFCDLDILIHENDLKQCCEVIETTGHNLVLSEKLIKKRKEIHLPYNNYILDVHWKLTPRFRVINLNIYKIWENRQSVFLFGKKIPVFSIEHALVQLCTSCISDRSLKINQIADIIHLIHNNPDISWENVQTEAESVNITRIVVIGLILAKIVGGINYNILIESKLKNDPIAIDLAKEKLKFFFKNTDNWMGFIQDKINYLKSQEKMKNRLIYIKYFIIDIALYKK